MEIKLERVEAPDKREGVIHDYVTANEVIPNGKDWKLVNTVIGRATRQVRVAGTFIANRSDRTALVMGDSDKIFLYELKNIEQIVLDPYPM